MSAGSPEGMAPLGHDVYMSLSEDSNGHIIGLLENHPSPVSETGRCLGAVTFDSPEGRALNPRGPYWQVEALEPLTISPSLLCRVCGHHGFIREGKWVPA